MFLKKCHSQISLLVKSSSPKGSYLNPVAPARTDWHLTSVKTVCFHCSAFATQDLLLWFIDPHFRLQLSYQIWKRKYKKKKKGGQLAQNSMKYGSADWILKWKHILVACEDTKEGFCSWKVIIWMPEIKSLTILRTCFMCKKELLKNNTPSNRFRTLKSLMLKIETPWVVEIQAYSILS